MTKEVTRNLCGAVALLAGCLLETSCSREDDPAAASKLLGEYLKRPESGEKFEAFLESWDRYGTAESLEKLLLERETAATDDEPAPQIQLTRAWLGHHLGNRHWAADSFEDFAENSKTGPWLTAQVRTGELEFFENLVAGAASIYQELPAEKEQEPFPHNGFLQSLRKLAGSPAIIWPMYETIAGREWGGENLAAPFLRIGSACSMAKKPERLFEFLRESPLYGALNLFDPIDRPNQDNRPTLWDEILFHLGHSGYRNRQSLISLLNRDRSDSFGKELLVAHLTSPIDEPSKTADLFQSRLPELQKLPVVRQKQIARLASRMTIRLSGKNIDPEGPYADFHQWLTDQGASSPGTALASTWIGADSFEKLPGADGQLKTRLLELMHTLLPRDPELTRETILHVARLEKEKSSEAEYANIQKTTVEDSLRSFLYADRSPAGRAFLLNTFEEGKGEICFVFAEALTEWVSWDLLDAFGKGTTPEERLARLKQQCGKLAEHLKIEDPGILIVPLFDVAGKFPRGGVDREKLIEWAEQEAANGPNEPVSVVLTQLAAAERLRVRMIGKGGTDPEIADEVESGLLGAITAETRDWQWRFALAARLLELTEGKMSDAFIAASVDLLCEGFAARHRLISYDEEMVFRYAHRLESPEPREEACRKLMGGWKKRFLTGDRSTHRYETLLRLCQIGIEFEDPEFADRILSGWEGAAKLPDALVAAVNTGHIDLAERLMLEHQADYSYPAKYFQRSDRFEKTAKELYARLAKHGKDNLERSGLDFQARAILYGVPARGTKAPVHKEAAGIAGNIVKAYRESDSPPKPFEDALRIMARSSRPPGAIKEPLQKWFDNFDIDRFVETGFGPDLPTVESIKLLNLWCVSKGGGRDTSISRRVLEAFQKANRYGFSRTNRNTLLDGLLDKCVGNFRHTIVTGDELTPEKLDEWIDLFQRFCSIPQPAWDSKSRGRDVGYLITATALAGKSAELQTWWRAMESADRNFLIVLGSDRSNVFSIACKLGKASKRLQSDPEQRRRFLIDLLAAPQPRYNMNFVTHWQKEGVATPEEILQWEEELLSKGPRSGNTARFLSELAFEKKQPEHALLLADRAIEDAGNIRLLRSKFQMEKARLLQSLGRADDGAAFLREAISSTDFQPDLKETAENLLTELGAP